MLGSNTNSNPPPQDLAGFTSCALTGRSNFNTFSDVSYQLEDVCEHVLAQHCDEDSPDFFMIRVAQVRCWDVCQGIVAMFEQGWKKLGQNLAHSSGWSNQNFCACGQLVIRMMCIFMLVQGR